MRLQFGVFSVFIDMFVFMVKSLCRFTFNKPRKVQVKNFLKLHISFQKVFFSWKLDLPNSGCSLCASVAYPPVFTVLLEVFSNIHVTHKIQPSVYLFLLELVFWLICHFFNFSFFFLLILRRFTGIAFPCFSMTHTSISGLSRPLKFPWLSRFFMNHTNPDRWY